jgi:hypothetical protein
VYCSAESNLVDLLPSDSQIVFGVRVRALVDSELARNLTAELKGHTAELQNIIAMTGFDPLHDLDEVLIGSTGTGKKAPSLVVARGRFDVARLAANAEQYHGVPLIKTSSAGAESVFGFLDETTALAGDAATVKAAVDGRAEPKHLDPALAEKVANYREHYEVWAVVNRPEGLAGYMPPSKGPDAALNSIDHFQFGVSVKQGLELAAEVHARSAKDADQLAATLQFLEAMTKAQQPASPGTSFAFKKEDGTLKISLAVSEEDLKKAIEQRQKAAVMFGDRSPLPLPSHTVTAPVEPAPKPAAQRAPVQPQTALGGDPAQTSVFTLPGRP